MMSKLRIHETPSSFSPSARGSSPDRRLSSVPSFQLHPSQHTQPFKVFVRIRPNPPNLSEDSFRTKQVLRVENNTISASDPFRSSFNENSKRFAFDEVFNQDATNTEIYHRTLKPLMPKLLDGFNTCCFAFGMTGSGKTHTMLGDANELNGLVQHSVRIHNFQTNDIFSVLEQSAEFQCKMSYLEIYNENVLDLLRSDEPAQSPDNKRKRDSSPVSRGFSQISTDLRRSNSLSFSKSSEKRNSLKILQDPEKGVIVKNLSCFGVQSLAELKELICRGNRKRTMAPTLTNEFSSRSHAVLQIHIQKSNDLSILLHSTLSSKLSLIDLAGSERGSSAEMRSKRMLEGSNINRSLLALCNCIEFLSDNTRKLGHVPYRNSKLTYLLKDSLGGKTRTVMIACVSALGMHYEESLSTLKYAERARKIKADKLVRNLKADTPSQGMAHYASVIENLETEISELKRKFSERFSNVPSSSKEILLKLSNNTSVEKSSTFYLSSSDHREESVSQRVIESSLEKSEDRPMLFRDKNSVIIERISRFLVKNIEEYVETNRTINDLKYDQHLLRVNLRSADQAKQRELEEEIMTKHLIMGELKESLEINLKQRSTLEKMLTTLNQQNNKNLKQNARAFHFENMHLKLKNMELKIKNKRLESENLMLTKRKQKDNQSELPSSRAQSFRAMKSDDDTSHQQLQHNSKYFQLHRVTRGQLFLQENGQYSARRSNHFSARNSSLDCNMLMKSRKFNQEDKEELHPQKIDGSWKRSQSEIVFSPLDTLRTNQEEFEFNIQSIVTPLPNRDRIVAPTSSNQKQLIHDMRKLRTQNSITLTVPMEGSNQENQRIPGAKAKLKVGGATRDQRQQESVSQPQTLETEQRLYPVEMENTGQSKLETVMNEIVDLKLNLDHTYSESDSVNIGSIAARVQQDQCLSHYFTPQTSKGPFEEEMKADPSACSTPNADELGESEKAGIMLPLSTQRKKIFAFKAEMQSKQARQRPLLTRVLPKVAESGCGDWRLINGGGTGAESSVEKIGRGISSNEGSPHSFTSRIMTRNFQLQATSTGNQNDKKSSPLTSRSSANKELFHIYKRILTQQERSIEKKLQRQASQRTKQLNSQSFTGKGSMNRSVLGPPSRQSMSSSSPKRYNFLSYLPVEKSDRRKKTAMNRYSDWKQESDVSSRENVNYENIRTNHTQLRESSFTASRTVRQSQMSHHHPRFSSKSNQFLKDILLKDKREPPVPHNKPKTGIQVRASPLKTSTHASALTVDQTFSTIGYNLGNASPQRAGKDFELWT